MHSLTRAPAGGAPGGGGGGDRPRSFAEVLRAPSAPPAPPAPPALCALVSVAGCSVGREEASVPGATGPAAVIDSLIPSRWPTCRLLRLVLPLRLTVKSELDLVRENAPTPPKMGLVGAEARAALPPPLPLPPPSPLPRPPAALAPAPPTGLVRMKTSGEPGGGAGGGDFDRKAMRFWVLRVLPGETDGECMSDKVRGTASAGASSDGEAGPSPPRGEGDLLEYRTWTGILAPPVRAFCGVSAARRGLLDSEASRPKQHGRHEPSETKRRETNSLHRARGRRLRLAKHGRSWADGLCGVAGSRRWFFSFAGVSY